VNKEAFEAGEEVGTVRVNRIMEIQPVMLVLLTQLCELLPPVTFSLVQLPHLSPPAAKVPLQ